MTKQELMAQFTNEEISFKDFFSGIQDFAQEEGTTVLKQVEDTFAPAISDRVLPRGAVGMIAPEIIARGAKEEFPAEGIKNSLERFYVSTNIRFASITEDDFTNMSDLFGRLNSDGASDIGKRLNDICESLGCDPQDIIRDSMPSSVDKGRINLIKIASASDMKERYFEALKEFLGGKTDDINMARLENAFYAMAETSGTKEEIQGRYTTEKVSYVHNASVSMLAEYATDLVSRTVFGKDHLSAAALLSVAKEISDRADVIAESGKAVLIVKDALNEIDALPQVKENVAESYMEQYENDEITAAECLENLRDFYGCSLEEAADKIAEYLESRIENIEEENKGLEAQNPEVDGEATEEPQNDTPEGVEDTPEEEAGTNAADQAETKSLDMDATEDGEVNAPIEGENSEVTEEVPAADPIAEEDTADSAENEVQSPDTDTAEDSQSDAPVESEGSEEAEEARLEAEEAEKPVSEEDTADSAENEVQSPDADDAQDAAAKGENSDEPIENKQRDIGNDNLEAEGVTEPETEPVAEDSGVDQESQDQEAVQQEAENNTESKGEQDDSIPDEAVPAEPAETEKLTTKAEEIAKIKEAISMVAFDESGNITDESREKIEGLIGDQADSIIGLYEAPEEKQEAVAEEGDPAGKDAAPADEAVLEEGEDPDNGAVPAEKDPGEERNPVSDEGEELPENPEEEGVEGDFEEWEGKDVRAFCDQLKTMFAEYQEGEKTTFEVSGDMNMASLLGALQSWISDPHIKEEETDSFKENLNRYLDAEGIEIDADKMQVYQTMDEITSEYASQDAYRISDLFSDDDDDVFDDKYDDLEEGDEPPVYEESSFEDYEDFTYKSEMEYNIEIADAFEHYINGQPGRAEELLRDVLNFYDPQGIMEEILVLHDDEIDNLDPEMDERSMVQNIQAIDSICETIGKDVNEYYEQMGSVENDDDPID